MRSNYYADQSETIMAAPFLQAPPQACMQGNATPSFAAMVRAAARGRVVVRGQRMSFGLGFLNVSRALPMSKELDMARGRCLEPRRAVCRSPSCALRKRSGPGRATRHFHKRPLKHNCRSRQVVAAGDDHHPDRRPTHGRTRPGDHRLRAARVNPVAIAWARSNGNLDSLTKGIQEPEQTAKAGCSLQRARARGRTPSAGRKRPAPAFGCRFSGGILT